jgi:hypothetical protein
MADAMLLYGGAASCLLQLRIHILFGRRHHENRQICYIHQIREIHQINNGTYNFDICFQKLASGGAFAL